MDNCYQFDHRRRRAYWKENIGTKGRCWILGNGYSLKAIPLDEFHQRGEVTFAMNQIHRVFDRVNEWVPTYYVKNELNDKWREYILKLVSTAKKSYIKATDPIYFLADELEWPTDMIVPIWTSCDHMNTSYYSERPKPEGWHLPKLCCYGGTMNVATQIAVLEGYNPIIYLGCDLGFEVTPKDMIHFDPEYPKFDTLHRNDATLIDMHKIIRKETQALGVDTLNATIGGLLEVHPRVDYREVLES